MRCQCCNKILHHSEIKFNKFLKQWDFCGICKDHSRHLYDDDYVIELKWDEKHEHLLSESQSS